MRKQVLRKWVLIGILVLAFLLRVIGLSEHPAGFTPDEASFGYDAYSLLQTGKDQWGKSWPLTFKSFGDYKLPLYTYLAMPSVAIFGLNEFAVRLPNAIIGTLAVLATYLLVRESKIGKSLDTNNELLATISALLVAVSPWHIPMSRGAFEANLTTFFLPLGVWAFLKAQKNSKYYFLAAVSFGLNIFTYHSARMVTPFIVIFLVLLFRNKLVKNQNSYLAAVLFGLLCLVAIITLLQGGGARASTATIFSETGYVGAFNDRFTAILDGLPPVLSAVVNNKLVYVANEFVQKYVEYFSIPFFWTQGPAEGTYGMMPGFGVLYWFESIFLIGFMIWVFKGGLQNNSYWLLFWLILAPIPAAISIGPGYAANRAVIMLPALHIASAIGGVFLYSNLRRVVSFKGARITFIVVFLASSLFFLEEYFYQQPLDEGSQMMYGVKETVRKASIHNGAILVSKKLSEPQIYFAFYNNIKPSDMQNASQSWNFEEQGFQWVDQLQEYRLLGYEFRNPELEAELQRGYAAVVVTPSEYKEGIEADVVTDPSGKPVYYIID